MEQVKCKAQKHLTYNTFRSHSQVLAVYMQKNKKIGFEMSIVMQSQCKTGHIDTINKMLLRIP